MWRVTETRSFESECIETHKMIMFQKVMTASYDNAVSIPAGG